MSEFGGKGRPTTGETNARTRELVRLVAAGDSLVDAAKTAGVKPERVLRLLDEPSFRQVWLRVRNGAGPVAVVLADPVDAAA